MEKFDLIPRYDTLNLFESSLQIRQICDQETIFYSCEIEKFNRYGFQQDRVLVVTNNQILTLTKGSLNFKQNRASPIGKINGITISKDAKSYEIVIHSF